MTACSNIVKHFTNTLRLYNHTTIRSSSNHNGICVYESDYVYIPIYNNSVIRMHPCTSSMIRQIKINIGTYSIGT